MRNLSNDNTWQRRDAWLGLLFLAVGFMLTTMLLRLLGQLAEPKAWLLLAIGGVGWLIGPLMLILGGNAIFQALRAPTANRDGHAPNL